MARRPPAPPDDKRLTAHDMTSGIERLLKRIDELNNLDLASITDYRSPQIQSLETAIDDTLASIFGNGTPKYNRYRHAADIEPHQVLSMSPGWISARGGYREQPGPDTNKLRQDIAKRRDAASAVLKQAVQSLSEELQIVQQSFDSEPLEIEQRPSKNAVFLVHGHDEAALQAVARFLEKLEIKPIILREQPDSGRTIIEKFEHYSSEVGFAVILLTPDDVAGTVDAPGSALRARQNVIFELGYFAGKLGRGRTCLLRKGNVEIPSDLYGVIYKDFDPAEAWKMQIVQELKAAQLDFDVNRMWS